MNKVSVELRKVSKVFGRIRAADDLSLRVTAGSFLTFLGPSGCGKTTTLRMIGGFELPTCGDILIMGKRIDYNVSANRQTNMVFQDYALFPHKTVGQNIGFGLKMRGWKRSAIEKEVRAMLELINLPKVSERMPHQLSGGQQQRVALARALILKPPVLLLDEPLGALDARIRKQLQIELKHLQQELGITFIYVTHDQEEAMTMSDVIGIMKDGKIEQLGTPQEIYETPRTLFVANFVGECNVFAGTIVGNQDGRIRIQNDAGQVFTTHAGSLETTPPTGRSAHLVVRPEDIQLAGGEQTFVNRLEGRVKEKLYAGSGVRLVVDVNATLISIDTHKGVLYAPRDRVEIGWHADVGSIILDD